MKRSLFIGAGLLLAGCASTNVPARVSLGYLANRDPPTLVLICEQPGQVPSAGA